MDILNVLKGVGGYWHYSGGEYLAELASGKVSDAYLNFAPLTARPRRLNEACARLVYKGVNAAQIGVDVSAEHPGVDSILRSWAANKNLHVCGPAMGGVTLAYEAARQLGGVAIFTEKAEYTAEATKNTIARQELKRFEIPDGATVLFVEDVITSGKSSYQMMEAVWQARGTVMGTFPYILCLVNRSGLDHLDGPRGCEEIKIVSLAEVATRTWDTLEEAEQDTLGERQLKYRGRHLKAVRPKENWAKLTGQEERLANTQRAGSNLCSMSS